MKNIRNLRYRRCSYCSNFTKIINSKRWEQANVFCDSKCSNLFFKQKRESKDGYLNCICPVCNKPFHIKPYRIARDKIHHCSKKCFNIAKKEYMKGKKNHQYGLKGEKNASFKSNIKITSYGYVKIRSLDHPYKDSDDMVFEHRLIAEKYLLTEENSIEIEGKRYLKKEYCVHHKDFNKLNNNVENLQVMTLREHAIYHSKLRANKK